MESAGTNVTERGHTPDGRRITTETVSRDGVDGRVEVFVYDEHNVPYRVAKRSNQSTMDVVNALKSGAERAPR